MVVGKAHEHHVGKALYSATLQNTALLPSVTSVSFYPLSMFFCAGQSPCDRKTGNQMARNLVLTMVSPSSDSTPAAILQFTYHAIRLSMLLQVLGLWLHVHLRVTFFLGLGLTVTEQKSTETRLTKH